MSPRLRLGLLLVAIFAVFSIDFGPKIFAGTEILELVNKDRAEQGLSPLKANAALNLAAIAKANDMLDQNYFAHVSPAGVQPWHWMKNLGYNYTHAGENLAEGFEKAKDLEKSWMESVSHRANILSPLYSEAGIAVVRQGNTSLVVSFFGSREGRQITVNR